MTIAHSGFDERSARPTTPTLQLRPYPRNSGEAAARIVALALIANGRMEAVETAVLDALEAPERLGLTRSQWHGVIDDLCADLLRTARCGNEICIPSEALGSMLDQLDDEDSRRLVLRLCSAVVQADSQIGRSGAAGAHAVRHGLPGAAARGRRRHRPQAAPSLNNKEHS